LQSCKCITKLQLQWFSSVTAI